jgi:hypothetical protein
MKKQYLSVSDLGRRGVDALIPYIVCAEPQLSRYHYYYIGRISRSRLEIF